MNKKNRVSRTPVGPDAKLSLRVPCVECSEALVAPLPIEHMALSDLADERAWFLTVMTPPGQAPITLGALCPSCATRVYTPEVLAAAVEARDRRRLS
jgi:hypothetical protein